MEDKLVSLFTYWRESVLRPLMLFIVFSIFCSVTIFFVFSFYDSEREINAIAKTINPEIRKSILINDLFKIHTTINGLGEVYNRDIQVIDGKGSTLAAFYKNSFNKSGTFNNEYKIFSSNGVYLGKLVIEKEIVGKHFVFLLIVSLLVIIFIFWASRLLLTRFKKIIFDFQESFNNSNYAPVFLETREIQKKSLEHTGLLVEKEKTNSKEKVMKQIAHDIRSPLEALRSVSQNLNGLDLTSKTIIKSSTIRIADIANGLLKQKHDDYSKKLFNLRILLEEIIATKNFDSHVKVVNDFELSYSMSFVNGNENQVFRSISNLINNAIESKREDEKTIEIKISLYQHSHNIVFELVDTGRGMSEELLNRVLKGSITTKKSGNGLGLSYSINTFEELGGEFLVESKEQKGTKIKIIIPLIDTPKWFSRGVEVIKENIVCIDDDPSFLELYKEKFKHVSENIHLISEKNISPEVFKDSSKNQYFIDYDLGLKKSGLDIISEYGVEGNSTLVTSMYQDEEIQKRCLEVGVKILPKQIFNNTNIEKTKNKNEVNSENLMCTPSECKEVILIDDDPLIHMSWKMEAKAQKIKIKTYHSVCEFLSSCSGISKDSSIYIDSNLGNNLKGEVEASKIFEAGYNDIYLATGYAANDFKNLPVWIKKVVGKRFPAKIK